MKSQRIIIINSCLILIIGLFSIDLYNPALPEMVKALNVTDSKIQSLVFYYLIGFSFSQLIYGPLSDKHGRIPIILFSIGTAAIANFLTFLAESFSTLALLRFLTGIAAGGCPVVSRAILSDTIKDKIEISKALSIFAMASQISPAFAPIIGGYISTYFSWNYNFLALSIILILGGVFIKYTLPETAPVNNNQSKTFSGFKILLTDSSFMIYSIVSALLFAITIGYLVSIPFIIQIEYSFSPKTTGFLFIFYSVGIVLGSYLTKQFLNTITPEKILVTSLIFLVTISLGFLIITSVFNLHFISLQLLYGFLIALGCGLSAPLLLGLSLFGHSNISGTGSALQGFIKMSGAAITLLIFSHSNTTSSFGLMFAISTLSTICLVMIIYCHISNNEIQKTTKH